MYVYVCKYGGVHTLWVHTYMRKSTHARTHTHAHLRTPTHLRILTHLHALTHVCYTRTVPTASLGKLLISGLEEDELVPVVRALDTHGMTQDPNATFEVRRVLLWLVVEISIQQFPHSWTYACPHAHITQHGSEASHTLRPHTRECIHRFCKASPRSRVWALSAKCWIARTARPWKWCSWSCTLPSLPRRKQMWDIPLKSGRARARTWASRRH